MNAFFTPSLLRESIIFGIESEVWTGAHMALRERRQDVSVLPLSPFPFLSFPSHPHSCCPCLFAVFWPFWVHSHPKPLDIALPFVGHFPLSPICLHSWALSVIQGFSLIFLQQETSTTVTYNPTPSSSISWICIFLTQLYKYFKKHLPWVNVTESMNIYLITCLVFVSPAGM